MDNVDHSELLKFARLADTWWDTDGDCKPLHDLNPCRGAFISERAKLEGTRILDVGCGGGILTEYLAAAGAEVTGIDANRDLIEVARLHAKDTNLDIRYECVSIEELVTGTDERYDVITCMELLEHVPDPQRMVNECSGRLSRDGDIFFSTINRTAKAYGLAILSAEYILKLLPRGTHDYANFIKPSELARWGRNSGLQALEFRGMTYNPITRNAALCNEVSVNFLAHLSAND
jgi:2-polyprenyl-6-hydroxyphenyl methylase/3-demethylubiquinone-9 3-methyltransferase